MIQPQFKFYVINSEGSLSADSKHMVDAITSSGNLLMHRVLEVGTVLLFAFLPYISTTALLHMQDHRITDLACDGFSHIEDVQKKDFDFFDTVKE